ncbi:unnamed protein product [Mytilus edulis]|uniref:Uncharacterized protein n=1 Tax=Mytilus edulis TaxID=6550 RepID=A0A8S3U3U8_MYTED|nr:unnamed protein product [Mytilus edulis]
MTKTALRLSNSEFRVGSMDAIFGLFVDMVHEEKRDGKTYICFESQFSWESNNEVQQRAMRSMPPGTSGPVSSQVYVATPVHIQPLMSMPSSRLSNDSYIPFGSPAQQAPQMASNAFLAHQIGNVGPRMPGFRTSGQIPSLLPPPVVQHPGPRDK